LSQRQRSHCGNGADDEIVGTDFRSLSHSSHISFSIMYNGNSKCITQNLEHRLKRHNETVTPMVTQRPLRQPNLCLSGDDLFWNRLNMHTSSSRARAIICHTQRQTFERVVELRYPAWYALLLGTHRFNLGGRLFLLPWRVSNSCNGDIAEV
jgi:hypothetical protein